MKGKICVVGQCLARFKILDQSGDQLLLAQLDAIPGDTSLVVQAWFPAANHRVVDDSYRPSFC